MSCDPRLVAIFRENTRFCLVLTGRQLWTAATDGAGRQWQIGRGLQRQAPHARGHDFFVAVAIAIGCPTAVPGRYAPRKNCSSQASWLEKGFRKFNNNAQSPLAHIQTIAHSAPAPSRSRFRILGVCGASRRRAMENSYFVPFAALNETKNFMAVRKRHVSTRSRRSIGAVMIDQCRTGLSAHHMPDAAEY